MLVTMPTKLPTKTRLQLADKFLLAKYRELARLDAYDAYRLQDKIRQPGFFTDNKSYRKTFFIRFVFFRPPQNSISKKQQITNIF